MQNTGVVHEDTHLLLFFFTDSITGAKSVLTRVLHLAQRYLLDPVGRQRAGVKGSQTQNRSRQASPARGQFLRGQTSASLTQARVRLDWLALWSSGY